MHFKYIKSVFLIILVFCTWSAMASETGKQVHYALCTTSSGWSTDEFGDHNVLQPLSIMHQATELVKPAKFLVKNFGKLNSAHVILNNSGVSFSAYGRFDNYTKDFYKRILFPFHGFW
jgi:hypothetical protein